MKNKWVYNERELLSIEVYFIILTINVCYREKTREKIVHHVEKKRKRPSKKQCEIDWIMKKNKTKQKKMKKKVGKKGRDVVCVGVWRKQ